MAVLDVDEVEAGSVRNDRGIHVARDEVVELGVGDHRGVVVDTDSGVEPRMAVRDAWPQRAVRARPAARVGELQAGHHLARDARSQFGELVRYHQLTRVRPPVGAHRDGFATPDEPGLAVAEASPPPAHQVGRATVLGPVPTFHRQDREPIRSGAAARVERLRERTARRVGRERELDAEPLEVCEEVFFSAKRPNLREARHRLIGVYFGVSSGGREITTGHGALRTT